jgi:hypothetical protein
LLKYVFEHFAEWRAFGEEFDVVLVQLETRFSFVLSNVCGQQIVGEVCEVLLGPK